MACRISATETAIQGLGCCIIFKSDNVTVSLERFDSTKRHGWVIWEVLPLLELNIEFLNNLL